MSTVELKQAIHQKIDSTEDEVLLHEVLYALNEKQADVCSEENLAELHRRRDKYLRGEGTNYTWDEVQTHMKEKFGI